MVDDEGPSRISRSLSARLRRKEQVARGEDVPETLEAVSYTHLTLPTKA